MASLLMGSEVCFSTSGPGEKRGRPAGEKKETEGESPEIRESKVDFSSPIKRPALMPSTFSHR